MVPFPLGLVPSSSHPLSPAGVPFARSPQASSHPTHICIHRFRYFALATGAKSTSPAQPPCPELWTSTCGCCAWTSPPLTLPTRSVVALGPAACPVRISVSTGLGFQSLGQESSLTAPRLLLPLLSSCSAQPPSQPAPSLMHQASLSPALGLPMWSLAFTFAFLN